MYLRIMVNDPIQDFIDWQRGSLWPDQAFKISNSTRGGRKWNLRSGKEHTTKINLMEDMMIEALDKKYHKRRKIFDRVLELTEQGYDETEIGAMTGFTKRTIFRILKRLKETWES